MWFRTFGLLISLGTSLVAGAADLSVATPEELLRVYGQLRQLQGSDQWAGAQNLVWKRDAGTFAFQEGRLTFAAPIEGRVLAAVFEGRGIFELKPPTPTAQHQIARFTKAAKLEDGFSEAVFFFTDDSWTELLKLVPVKPGGDAQSATKRLESAQKKYAEGFNEWWENQRKGNPTMRNIAARMLADLSDPSSRGLFLADFKTDHLGHSLYQVSWNRDSLLLPEFSNDEEVMLLHYDHNNYFEWWAGFHRRDEYAKNPRPEHRQLLVHCRQERIEAEVSKDNHLAASAAMEFEVPGGSPRLLPLNLRGVLRIGSVQDASGKKLAFIQEDRKLDSDPWLILPEPATAGKVYNVKIDYEEDSNRDSRIIHQLGSGLFYVTSRESWYPSFGAFDDRAQYTLRFRSPKKFTLVATGRPGSSEKIGNVLETEWQTEIPYGVVGFNYGDFASKSQSDSKLTVTAYNGREIPDELKNLQSAIDVAQLGTGPNRSAGDVAGRAGLLTGGWNTANTAQYAAGISYQALKLYENYFGPLPFKNVSVTEQPVRGYGQSWPTLIFLPYDSLLDATTRHNLGLADSAEAREFYNIVAVHEMAHQWWGHLVGEKTYHDVWLSEGFAEFSAALYLRAFDPKKVKSFWDLKRKWLLSKNTVGHRPVDVGPLWLSFQLPAHFEPGNYQSLVYFKGAYVLEMLRTLMEDSKDSNPDARFIAMMREFVTTYAGKTASTEDFHRVVAKHFHEPMDWFFDQWVYGTEIPHYDFSYQLKEAPGGKTALQVSLEQSDVSDSFQMRVPMYAYVNGEPRRLGFISARGSTKSNGEATLPFRPDKIVLDEYHSILCTVRQ